MLIHEFGNINAPVLVLVPGTYASWQIFVPLIERLREYFRIVVSALDGQQTDIYGTVVPNTFTTVDDQARQIEEWLLVHAGGVVDTVYGISLGGAIGARLAERNNVKIKRLVMDAAPITSFSGAMRVFAEYYQAMNVWCICRFGRLYRLLFRSHYYHTLFDEFDRTFPCDGPRTAVNVFRSLFSYRLQSLPAGIVAEFWYGSKELLFSSQARHAQRVYKDMRVIVFPKMNHAQLLIDCPEELAGLLRKTIDNIK